jgi:hypothetical protein
MLGQSMALIRSSFDKLRERAIPVLEDFEGTISKLSQKNGRTDGLRDRTGVQKN